MTQEFKGFVWGLSIHTARSSQCGTSKRGKGKWGQRRDYMVQERIHALPWYPNHSVCVLSQGGSPGTSIPGEKGQQESSLHLRSLSGDGKILASLGSPFGAEKQSEM